MPFGNQELTDTGVSYLTQAQLGEQLRITRMQVGKGVAANLPDDLWPLTDLIDPVMDIPIIASNYVSPDTLRVTGQLSSLDVPSGGGFELNEVGIMAECGVLIEALYSVDNTGGNGDFVPDIDAPAPVVQVIDLYIKISRATNITIAVSPAGTYEATNRGDPLLGPGPYIEKVGDVLHFKRFVAGSGIEITEDTLVPPETITIGFKTIDQDMDLYVAAGNPDVSPNFSTLQNAIDHLRGYFIPTNLVATIHCAGEDFNLTIPAKFDHPDGQQISIVGEPVEVRTTTYVSVSNLTNTMILTMDTTGIKVGDCLRALNGGNPTHHGIFKVITVDATTVTVQMAFVYAFAYDGALAMEVTVWKTRFICTDNDAIHIGRAGLDRFTDIQLIGNGTTNYGIDSLGAGEIENVSIHGFGTGMITSGTLAFMYLLKGGIGFCSAGLVLSGSSFVFVGGPIVFNNCSYGVHVRQSTVNISSTDDTYYSVFVNNYGQAIRFDSGATGSIYYVYIVYNPIGIALAEHASMIFGSRPPNLASIVIANGDAGSGTMNVWASSSSVCHGTVNPGGTLGPTFGHGVDNAFINVVATLLREEELGPILDLLPRRRGRGRLPR